MQSKGSAKILRPGRLNEKHRLGPRLHRYSGAALIVGGLAALVILSTNLYALGTYAEGRKVIRLLTLESRGLMFRSYEGDAVMPAFDDDEKCDEKKYQCYTPTSEKFQLSIRPEKAQVVNFMRQNRGREMIIFYRIHRIEPAGLETGFEVLDVYALQENPPDNFRRAFKVKRTGSREFDIYGRVLSMEYRGTAVGTFEGLFLDAKRRKVHPFSVTNKEMAAYIYDTMLFRRKFHLGISVAIVTGMRESDYDIFEVNYDQETGAEVIQPTKADAKKATEKK